jgi:CRISPR system Cascade subunit CasA
VSDFSFDLLERPWIPCLFAGEVKPVELGIRDVLARSGEIVEVRDTSPLATIAIHRLLLAILHRSVPRKDKGQGLKRWVQVWEDGAGSLPTDDINTYLGQWPDRFDLFHPTVPFYQCAALEMPEAKGMRVLTVELENSPGHFDHAEPTVYSPAQAARTLAAVQAFASGGLLRQSADIGGKSVWWLRGENGPLYNRAVIWLTGRNLFQTLMLNFVPDPLEPKDKPAWEWDDPALWRDDPADSQRPRLRSAGVLDRLTWQSRLIRLLPDEGEEGPVVRRCYLTHGRNADPNRGEPMFGYIASRKEGFYPLTLSREKASWRDIHSLLIRNGGEEVRPKSVEHVAELALYGDIDANLTTGINVAGLSGESNRVAIHLWRHDRTSLPAAFLADQDLAARLGALVREAEDGEGDFNTGIPDGVARQLFARTKQLCTYYLAPRTGEPDARPAKPEDVSALLKRIDPRQAYWARLESHFHHLLTGLADPERAPEAEAAWRRDVEREATRAMREAARSLGHTGGSGAAQRVIQALARVSADFICGSARLAERRDRRERVHTLAEVIGDEDDAPADDEDATLTAPEEETAHV